MRMIVAVSRFAVVASFLVALLLPRSLSAAAWTQPKGGGYVKAWVRFQAAIGFLDGWNDEDGDFHYTGDYAETGLHFYGEYGLTDRLTAIGNVPAVKTYWVDQQDFFGASPGDPTVGLRYGLIQKNWVLSAQVTSTVPLVDDRARTTFRDLDTDEQLGVLKFGAGVFDIEPRIQFGFGTEQGHFGLDVGRRIRTGGFQDQWVWTIEGGYQFTPNFYFTVRALEVWSVGQVSADFDDSLSGIGNGTSFTGFALEGNWQLDERLSVGGVLEGATRYERQSGGPVFNAFVAYDWE